MRAKNSTISSTGIEVSPTTRDSARIFRRCENLGIRDELTGVRLYEKGGYQPPPGDISAGQGHEAICRVHLPTGRRPRCQFQTTTDIDATRDGAILRSRRNWVSWAAAVPATEALVDLARQMGLGTTERSLRHA